MDDLHSHAEDKWLDSQKVLCAMLNILDVNECAENTDTCSENAQCNNQAGSYDCVCNQGYNGNGQACDGEYRKEHTK